MNRLLAALLVCLLALGPARAADVADGVPQLPQLPAPAAGLPAAVPVEAALEALAAPQVAAPAALAHLDALAALAAASPAAITPAQTARLAALRVQLPAKLALSDPKTAKVIAVKMDKIAALLAGRARAPQALPDGADAASEADAPLASQPAAAARLSAAARQAPSKTPAFIPAPPAAPRPASPLWSALRRAWSRLTGAAKPLGLGIDTSAIDPSVRPQDDFYRHVNGTWLKTYQLPGDKAEFGSFDAVNERSQAAVKAIIEGAAQRAKTGEPDAAKIAGLYASFMDTDKLEALGLKPLEQDFAAVARVKGQADVVEAWGQRMREGYAAPVELGIGADPKEPDANIVELGQGGLGLPDRDYYFDQSEDGKKIQTAYVAYLAQLLTLGGEKDAPAKAQRLYDLEKAIAALHWTNVQTRDVEKTYNKMTVAQLSALAPGFDWAGFLSAAGIPDGPRRLLVDEPSFMTGFAELFAATPVEDWKLMMKARTLASNAPYLNKAFVDASFEFNKLFTGQTEQTPRWKKGVRLVNGVLGEAVGKLYVQDNFPAQSQQRMEAMVENLRAGFAERIKGLDWMSEATKARALDKLSKFRPKIGAPKKWLDYSALEVESGDLVGNIRRSDRFDYQRMLDKLGKPVDRDRWGMTPQTVNAYYNPLGNEIVFPAAILQAPFFDPLADDAVNYGAIGAVIGHEMSHGFDDQGAKFDGEGRMTEWWTPQDEAAFKAKTKALIGQYDGLEPVPGARVNGALTLGENIGDLGGLTVAYRAYRMSLKGREPPVIDGLTGDQRFFMGWAQVWRTIQRDEALRGQVATDPHSPAEYRVNVIVSNMPEFYKAFGLKPGDKLFREPGKRVSIW